jgi:hypothetical protein
MGSFAIFKVTGLSHHNESCCFDVDEILGIVRLERVGDGCDNALLEDVSLS